MNEHFPYRLLLLRHGQSEWKAAGVFTGWENAHLTAQGALEATRAGVMLAEHGVLPAFAHLGGQYVDPHAVRNDIATSKVLAQDRP